MKNSVTVTKLTSNQTVIKKEAISLPCFPNDFIIVSRSILVACNDTAQNHYCVDTSCSNIPANLNDGVSPIVYSGMHQDGSIEGLIIATTVNHKLVTHIDRFATRRLHILPNGCSEALNLSRKGSTVLLTCTNEMQYWVNITSGLEGADFYSIDSNHGELLALSTNGFAIFLAGSQLTLQNILNSVAITETISIDTNANHTVSADFTTDGRFAFIAVNSTTVLFIYVTEAIAGNGGQFYHTVTTTLCPTCPAVQFLSTMIAIVSSYGTQVTSVSVLLLTEWPPCVYMDRVFIDQPRQYWLNPSAPLPSRCGVVLPSTVTTVMTSPSVTSTSPAVPSSPTASNNSDDDALPSGAIAGIIIGSLVVLIVIVMLVILVVVFVVRRPGACNNTDNNTEGQYFR